MAKISEVVQRLAKVFFLGCVTRLRAQEPRKPRKKTLADLCMCLLSEKKKFKHESTIQRKPSDMDMVGGAASENNPDMRAGTGQRRKANELRMVPFSGDQVK